MKLLTIQICGTGNYLLARPQLLSLRQFPFCKHHTFLLLLPLKVASLSGYFGVVDLPASDPVSVTPTAKSRRALAAPGFARYSNVGGTVQRVPLPTEEVARLCRLSAGQLS